MRKILLFSAIFSIFALGCGPTKQTGKTDNTTASGSTKQPEAATITTSKPGSGLPFDPMVKTGTLPNGMKYYIKQNSKPEKRVELRLAINAGAMQEDEDQRGLAHFIEHMAFNGTKNFLKNDLVNFLESTGVRFGADLNAYTSFDETVYMLQIPTDKPGLLDKGLLVMEDWAGGQIFDLNEIEKERGVVMSEWRTGLGANERMRQVWWPKVFYKTRYADRLPIGLPEILQNATRDKFVRFFNDWYRPNLMALVVVGDLNPAEMEKEVVKRFSKLPNPANERKKETYPVPSHTETLVAVASDKEATNTIVQMLYKHEPKKVASEDDFRTNLMVDLANNMLNDRLAEYLSKPTSPFIFAYSGYGSFVRSKDAFMSYAASPDGGATSALKTLVMEAERMKQFGFLESELQRHKEKILNDLANELADKDKTESENFAQTLVSHFLEGSPAFSIDQKAGLMQKLLSTISIGEVNQVVSKWVSKENRAIVITANEREGAKLPTEKELLDAVNEAETMKLEPYKDSYQDAPLMTNFPTKVSVVSEAKNPTLGTIDYVLSNGIKVVVKPTDFKNDEILFSAFSPGGTSVYNDDDYAQVRFATEVVGECGVGAFKRTDLEKKLNGMTVSVTPQINELYEGLSGSCAPKDMETMFQLIALYVQQPREDKEAFEATLKKSKEMLKFLALNPQIFFYESMNDLTTNGHPRKKLFPTEKDFDVVELKRLSSLYKDRFGDSDFTFVFTGNVDPASIRPMLEKYMGAFPQTNRKEQWKDLGIRFPKGQVEKVLEKGKAPQSNVALLFEKETKLNPERNMQIRMLGEIFKIVVRENLREDKGGVYSPQAALSFDREPFPTLNLFVSYQSDPTKSKELLGEVYKEINKLATEGASEENFNKAKEILTRAQEKNVKENQYWLGQLEGSLKYKIEPTNLTRFDEILKGITLQQINDLAKETLKMEEFVSLIVNPEPQKD